MFVKRKMNLCFGCRRTRRRRCRFRIGLIPPHHVLRIRILLSIKIFNLSNLLSLNVFFGNIPLTALLIISSGFFSIISLYLISFNPPGNIVWCL